MTEPNRSKLSIKRKPKVYVNPKLVDKPVPQPPKPAKQPKVKASSPVKEPKPKQVPPKPLSREERIAKKRAKKLQQGQEAIASLITHWPQLFSSKSLYTRLCNCLILICSIQHQKQVTLWTKNSYRLYRTGVWQ